MKILHINMADTLGGAARGCYWLHKALQDAGVDSHMLVLRKASRDPSVHVLSPGVRGRIQSTILPRLDSIPSRWVKKDDAGVWSTEIFPNQIVSAIEDIAPDIVNLHWVGAGFLPIAALKKIECPIIWTMRDMWPMTGGCHYTNGCQRFENKCGSCPQLSTNMEWDLSRLIWHLKQKHWRDLDLHLVAISHWLKESVEKSSILGDYPVSMIPNGIFLDCFKPTDKRVARQILGLPQERRLVLFGALSSTTDTRKGFHHLRGALELLAKEQNATDLEVVVFGNGEQPKDNLPLPTHYLGRLHDDIALTLAYSAADVMVVPSIEEAFGKTVIEAMACKTPVVAFDTGGPRDIIEHKKSGYLAGSVSADALAAGIDWTIEAEERIRHLSDAALERAKSTYDIHLVAAQYVMLYKKILEFNRQN